VMSAEALLENPALFSGEHVSPFQIAREYLALASVDNAHYVPIYDFHKCTKAHIARFLHAPIRTINKMMNHGEGVLTSGAASEDCAIAVSVSNSVSDLFNAVDCLEQQHQMVWHDLGIAERADSWYRRHHCGSIETDRSKRKQQQRLWIDAGLRMTR
jgi:hypothetical protein